MMKKYLSIIFLTLAIAGSSCKKDFLNLTVNPNVPSAASPNLLLSGALKTTADIVNGGDYVQYTSWVGYLTQSTSFQVFTNLSEYILTTSDYNGPWTDNYLNISNYAALEKATAEPNYTAIAEIMICYDYEALVDNYNNVPYSQALKGASNLNPSYDSGQSIYLDLTKRLDAAIKLIQGAPSSALNPLGADIMFGGNMTNWAKFANTLKLRLALRESTKSSLSADYATLSASVTATASVGYIDDTFSASLNPGYQNNDANGGQQSPLWKFYGTTQGGTAEVGKNEYQANSQLANFYGSNNDLRLGEVFSNSATAGASTAKITSPTAALNVGSDASGNTVAVISTSFGTSSPVAGTIGGTAIPNIAPSAVGTGLLVSPTQDAVIMSSAESLFLQAEATVRGILPGGAAAAATLYNAGIAASFEFDQVPNADAAAATYYGQSAIAFPTGGTLAQQIQAIITQKWAALAIFGGFEAFNEQRRTGYPAASLSVYGGVNAPRQVTRIQYPFVEYSTNAAAVAAQGTINTFTSLIFWAQ